MGKTLIRVECIDQRLYVAASPAVASGGRNEDAVEFSFCPLWEGFEKTAVFYRTETEQYHAPVTDDRCIIPHEVLADEGTMYFGVYGVKGDITRTSEVVRYRVVKGAIVEGTSPSRPTANIFAQIRDGKANALKATASGDIVTIWPDEGSSIIVETDGTKIARCGKNICPGVENGIAYMAKYGTDMVSEVYCRTKKFPVIPGVTYVDSNSINTVESRKTFHFWDANGNWLGCTGYTLNNRPEGAVMMAVVYYHPVAADIVEWAQVEAGTVATEYEPYTAYKDADVVDGIAVIPAITGKNIVFSDGTSIKATYNKSLAKVVEELTNAIISMGGNV